MLRRFWRLLTQGPGHGVDRLAGRLELTETELRRLPIDYRPFTLPKRGGGRRTIHAPQPALKRVQRRILRRLLARLHMHPAAVGFRRGISFVHHACLHRGQAVVVRMDVRDFFPSITAARVEGYFRRIGYNRDAAEVLSRLCTFQGALPQGAPTSPTLSNLVNVRLDARLAGLVRKAGGLYTRYADDLTFSFGRDPGPELSALLRRVRRIVREEGYRVHRRRKMHVRRQHQRQLVAGLVVNRQVQLPREVRRWLRAVEHRHRTEGLVRPAPGTLLRMPRRTTLSEAQLAGWRNLQAMIRQQAQETPRSDADV